MWTARIYSSLFTFLVFLCCLVCSFQSLPNISRKKRIHHSHTSSKNQQRAQLQRRFLPSIVQRSLLPKSEEERLSLVGKQNISSPNMLVKMVGSTTSMVVAGTFMGVLAYQRDALMVSFWIGSISNGILSKVLKKLINQERPEDLSETITLKPSDGGMPSSHAMSLGFIGTFTALHLPSWTILPIGLYTGLSLVYRVQTNLHTWPQIIVGLVVGTSNALVWNSFSHGTNPFNIHVMQWVSQNLLVDGKLPLPLLAIPALVGLVVVGSFERRIGRWISKRKEE